MKSKQESFTRQQAAEINYILTEEREVAVLKNWHLTERLQQEQATRSVSISRREMSETDQWLLRGRVRTFLARCSGRRWSPSWRLMGTSS